MDRNQIIGWVLIFAIVLGYTYYQSLNPPPVEENTTTEQVEGDSTSNTVEKEPITFIGDPEDETIDEGDLPKGTNDSLETIKRQSKYGEFFPFAEGEASTYVLENDELKITFNSKGGVMQKVELKQYQTWDSLPLLLWEGEDNDFNISFLTNGLNRIDTKDLYFKAKVDKANNSISFSLPVANGKYLEHYYKLPDEGYLVDFNLNAIGLEDVIARNATHFELFWKENIQKLEKDKTRENGHTNLYYSYFGDDLDNLADNEEERESLTGDVKWVSHKRQFFNATLIAAKKSFDSGILLSVPAKEEEENYLKHYTTNLNIPYHRSSTESFEMQFYLGPNHYQTLKKLDLDLHKIIRMGYVAIINRWVIIPIFNFLDDFIDNYGIIILILTVFIKLVLSPLTYKSYVSSAKMKLLQPELTELKEKYKDDQQKFASEQMKLYGKAGVNPLGGCLPMLLQFPILIAMFYFFPASIELRQESFLWATDLSTYDSIYDLGTNIPLYGDHISLFTILMAISSVLYAMTNTQMTGAGGQMAAMKYMPYIMPIFFIGIFNSMPAALTYYYFLANMFTFAQQLVIKNFIIDEEKLHKQIQERKKKPKKKSGFMAKYEELLKQQQQQQAQKKKK